MTESPQNVPPPSDAKPPKRRRGCLHRLWRVFLVYLLVSIALSLIPERPLNVDVLSTERVAFSGDLLAGAAKVLITPPKEMWNSLNLYDEKGPIVGVADDLYARALTLGAAGSPESVSIVSVEILIIPPAMLPALREELARRGLKNVHVTLNATHTHAGPGNFWDLWFGGSFMGKYSPEFFSFLVGRAADAVEASVKTMCPARIGFADAPTRYFLKQRRYTDPVTGLAPPVDESMGVVRVDARDGGATIAYAVNLGAHPTTLLHKTAKRISGEYPGALSGLLETRHRGAVALFLQGAVGSVRSTSPRTHPGPRTIDDSGFAEVAIQADMLYQFVAEAEKGMTFDDTIDLSSALVKVALPAPDAHFFPEQRPWLLARVLTIVPDWCLSRVAGWVMLPHETVFQATRINHAYLLMFPCDLSNRLGWELKRYIRRDHVFVLGHSNDYSLGYVLAREEYDMGGMRSLGWTERIQDYFGKRAGPYCIKVAWELANMVREKDADDVFQYPFGEHYGTIPGRREPSPSP